MNPKYTHRTRSGLPARIVFTDPHATHHPVIAKVNGDTGESLLTLTISLRYLHDGTDHELDLLEVPAWEFERPDNAVVEVGKSLMSCLMGASVCKSLGGLGGSQMLDLSDFPVEFHDLILAYLNQELSAVEATYIAMHRAEAQHAGQ